MGYSSYFIPSSSSTSSNIIPILIITCSLLIPIAFPINDTQLDYKCLPNTKPFTDNYSQSRVLVVLNLIIYTASSPNEGFRTASYTWPLQGSDDERAYGLALCRVDVSPDDCKTCVKNASLTIIDEHHCPESRAAILWRDYCFFKYSDDDFLGKIDIVNMFRSLGDKMWNLEASGAAVKKLMGSLSQTAIQSPKLYAYGTANIMDDPFDPYDSVTVYGAWPNAPEIFLQVLARIVLTLQEIGFYLSNKVGGYYLGVATCDSRYIISIPQQLIN